MKMQGVSVCVAILVAILLVIDGAVVLYACLIWPQKDASDSLFAVGIVTFVICFTLPFVLITGFLVIGSFSTSIRLGSSLAKSL